MQRMRLRWDLLGDQCTSYFFKCVKESKSRNEIRALKNAENGFRQPRVFRKSLSHSFPIFLRARKSHLHKKRN